MAYLTLDEYKIRHPDYVSSEQADKALAVHLAEAERQIDSLTFNRITARGFVNLTTFQQGIIKDAVAKQTDFLFDYSGMLTSPLSGYSINGVSMNFKGAGVVERGGVYVSRAVWALLLQTGLAVRTLP